MLRSCFARFSLLQQRRSQPVISLCIPRLQFCLSTKFFLRLRPLRRARVHLTEFKVEFRDIRPESQRLLEFLLRLGYLTQDELVLGKRLVCSSARGIGGAHY